MVHLNQIGGVVNIENNVKKITPVQIYVYMQSMVEMFGCIHMTRVFFAKVISHVIVSFVKCSNIGRLSQ